jgi:hypothetical protein
MKIGKLPGASIVLLVLTLTSFIMRKFYPGEYALDSQFIEGAFFGVSLMMLLYFFNIRYTAWVNIRKEITKDNQI